MIGFRMVAFSGLAVILAAPALAQSASPYDMTYKLRAGAAVPLYADMSDKAAHKGSLPGDAKGIVLRWCRDEIPFGSWQFGSHATQMKLLDTRWCEVSFNGLVGDVPGSVLEPQ